MANSFIPSFHWARPSEKLKPEWCYEAVQRSWHQCHNIGLLDKKNVKEIEDFATGTFSLNPFRKMYKSQKEDAIKRENNPDYLNTTGINHDGSGLGYYQLALLPPKINSACSVIQKIPIEVSVTAIDPLATKKKQEDIQFLKNKPALEEQLQELADQMNIGKVDLGTTKHSAIPFSSSPYGLDLNEPDELQVFVDLLYNLSVEAGFETALQSFWEIKNGVQIKLLEIKDQFHFGVSCHKPFQSSMTGLPDFEYKHPINILTPYSKLPDFSDNTHRFELNRITPIDLFNSFGDEICNEETLDKILNEKEIGYCACNGIDNIRSDNFNSHKLDLIYCEIKSVDYVGVMPVNKKSKFTTIIEDEGEAEKCSNKVWGQNTYCFFWLKNTKHFFGIKRLDFAHRTVGQESYQNFSTNIYRSQEKSAVELSIGENKKAQIADIKLNHAVIKSLPAGKYINLKFLRSALAGLIEEKNKWTMQDLIDLAMEQNYFVGDTEGFDGKNDGQLKPFEDIPGGLKTEVVGYMNIIASADQTIDRRFGTNDSLTGQSADPNALIGVEKLRINASINAIYYVNEAIEHQYQKLFTNWATVLKNSIERGGKSKKAIVDLVGAKKVSLIDSLEDVPLHQLGCKVSIKQREEERQKFDQELNRLKINGVINTVDEYMLEGVINPKDKMALLAIKVKQWEKREAKKRAEDFANQQTMIQKQGENQQNAVRAKTDGEIKKIYAQGDTNSKILQLASQLGIQDKQMDYIGKRALQQDRGQSAIDKNIQTLQQKASLEAQQPLSS